MIRIPHLCFAALVFIASLSAVRAQAPKARPTFWISPPGQDNAKAFRELFERPGEWKDTRALVDVLFYTDLGFQRNFKDDAELTRWFAQARDWKLKLALEAGAIKEWGKTGAECFAKEKANWERLQKLGANLYAVAMDEPLVCTREHIHESDEYAVEETANYVAEVRKHFPEMLVGDIEAYPSSSVEDHERWIEALNKRLADKGVRGLDFYRLDVDWLRFNAQGKGSWKDVRELERWCRQKKLPFQLIYWASGYPAASKRGLADDSTWYTAIMQQGYDYALIDGKPDAYVIESWIGAPSRCLPDNGEWTFTRSVRDFVRKFITK
ncbi:MAG: hypothetical protein ABJF10_21940 [Chthoniobacter sp.]|uniref:hypothetical protein n=1 Tax=Chthoniobacter sp. TaxID=2510640 RepID=UPI0032A8A1F4